MVFNNNKWCLKSVVCIRLTKFMVIYSSWLHQLLSKQNDSKMYTDLFMILIKDCSLVSSPVK